MITLSIVSAIYLINIKTFEIKNDLEKFKLGLCEN